MVEKSGKMIFVHTVMEILGFIFSSIGSENKGHRALFFMLRGIL
jgi:hypothetical protein